MYICVLFSLYSLPFLSLLLIHGGIHTHLFSSSSSSSLSSRPRTYDVLISLTISSNTRVPHAIFRLDSISSNKLQGARSLPPSSLPTLKQRNNVSNHPPSLLILPLMTLGMRRLGQIDHKALHLAHALNRVLNSLRSNPRILETRKREVVGSTSRRAVNLHCPCR